MGSENDPALERYRYIWDNESSWALIKGEIPCAKLIVDFEGNTPNAREIIAIRKIVEQFHDKSLKEIIKQLGGSKNFELGLFTGFEMRNIIARIKTLGLSVQAQDASYKGYIPYDPITGYLLINLALENRELFEKLVQTLLLKGVPTFNEKFEVD